MEIELSDVSGLPDALKAVVQTVDGKSKLNLAQLVPASELEGFKGKLQAVTAESIERRKALDAWKVLGTDPLEVQAKLAKGADPAIIDQMRAEAAKRETEYKTKLQQIVTDRAMSDMKAELARVGVIPSALDDVALVARGMLQMDDDGSIRVMGADGKPMIGSGANGGATLSDLAKKLAEARPWAVSDAGKGGAGKPPESNSGTFAAKTIKREAFLALSPTEQAKAIASGVKPID